MNYLKQAKELREKFGHRSDGVVLEDLKERIKKLLAKAEEGCGKIDYDHRKEALICGKKYHYGFIKPHSHFQYLCPNCQETIKICKENWK